MKGKQDSHSIIRVRITSLVLTFILLIIAVSIAACNLLFNQSDDPQDFSDENACM